MLGTFLSGLNGLLRLTLKLTCLFYCVYESSAGAWEQHQVLMPFILKGTSLELQKYLDQKIQISCVDTNQKIYQDWIHSFHLNPKTVLPPELRRSCEERAAPSVSLYQSLLSPSVDEPDQGMDQDLPAELLKEIDPSHDHVWMGGNSGPTSQGFRHMFFAGFLLNHPLRTVQIPLRSLGQAPARFRLFAHEARTLLRSHQMAEGSRLLTWALHYLQDLGQPFRTTQIVHFKLVPFAELLHFPPTQGFKNLVHETTRTIANYHWAYEQYVRHELISNPHSVFKECLTHPERTMSLGFGPKREDIEELAYQVAQESRLEATHIASRELNFFGSFLLQPDVDLTRNLISLNYAEYSSVSQLETPRLKLHQITCRALARTALASRILIEWALKP